MTTLKEILVWATTVGAGVLAYWLIDAVDWLSGLPPRQKRLAAVGLTAIIAVAAWGLQIVFQYLPSPADWRSWIEAIVGVAAVAFSVSQGLHAWRDLATISKPPG